MIYLDNAATTWPKPIQVRNAVCRALTQYGANPGRGGHSMGMAAAEQVYACRQTAAKLFHAPDETHVIFTVNCTMALNMAIKGILKQGGRAVISGMEHNAVLRPLYALSPHTPLYDIAPVVPGDDDATVAGFRRCITPQTKVIICTHMSNVTGSRLPIRRIGELAHRFGLLFVVDAAQSAGLYPIDMERDNIDFLCVPGHKGLYGPMGTGMLLCSDRFLLPPLLEGGTGSLSRHPEQPEELPDRLESGTLNVPGICGLHAGMQFVMREKLSSLAERETALMDNLRCRLQEMGATVYGETGQPLLSFNLPGVPSEVVGEFLAQRHIAVRAGLHCAPLAHRQNGTWDTGTVRVAPSAFTTRKEIEYFEKTVREYVKFQRPPLQTPRNVV